MDDAPSVSSPRYPCANSDVDRDFRVRALYNKSRIVVYSVASLLAFEFAANAWLLSHGAHGSQVESMLREC